MPAIRKITTSAQREDRISKAFKHALVEKRWTVQHLADLCCMKASNVSRTINHPLNVKLDTILMIASKLGIDSIPT